MSEIVVKDCEGLVDTARVYDLEECVRASGFPMETEIKSRDLKTFDYTRSDKLAKNPPGSGHNNFLKGIGVSFNLTFTKQAWSEAERYSWFDLVSSQSTIHRLSQFDLDQAYLDYVDDEMIRRCKELQENFLENSTNENYLKLLYSSPAGIKLTCRINTNYLQLKTIYHQRKNHKLPEWRKFCEWIETLPHSDWITENKESTTHD